MNTEMNIVEVLPTIFPINFGCFPNLNKLTIGKENILFLDVHF